MIDYGWTRGGPTCSHAYLLPGVLRALPREPQRIVDLGCGNGHLASVLAELGHRVVGIDRAPDGLALARSHYPAVTFECADIDEALATRHPRYDVVISTEVIEHLYSPRALLRTAHALLRPGGLLLLSTPYHGYWKNLALAVTGKLDRHFTATWDGGHIKFFSPRTLAVLASEAGFRDLSFSYVGRTPLLWKSMILSARTPPPDSGAQP